MPDQQDRALGGADQPHRLGHLALTGGLVDQPVPVRRQRVGHVELGEDHVGGVFDVGRAGRAGHGPAQRLVDDLVGLVGVFDGRAVFDRRREKRLLAHELMRPRRTRRSVTRARWPPRKITGEFSTSAHWMAPAMLAMPGPSVPMHRPGLPVIRDAASAMNPALSSWCGETTDQPRDSASKNMCTKLGSGMPNRVFTPRPGRDRGSADKPAHPFTVPFPRERRFRRALRRCGRPARAPARPPGPGSARTRSARRGSAPGHAACRRSGTSRRR